MTLVMLTMFASVNLKVKEMSRIQIGDWYRIKPDADQKLLKIDTDTDETVPDRTLCQVWFNEYGWVLVGINENVAPRVFARHLFLEYFEQVGD